MNHCIQLNICCLLFQETASQNPDALLACYFNTSSSFYKHIALQSQSQSQSQSQMAGFFHTRTSSDPPTPHPLVLKLDQDLHTLKSSLTLHNAFKEVANLYKLVDEVLRLPTIQQSLGLARNKKWLEEQLDMSVKFLDLVSSARDCMVLMREDVATRKKKLVKETRICFKLLKQMAHASCVGVKDHWDLMLVDRVLVELKGIVVDLVRSLMGSLSSVSRAKSKGKSEGGDGWKEVEGRIEEVESGLEFLFRILIQNRVSLLNIVSLL